MKKIDFFIMYCCAGLVMCLLYAPQPIAPILENELQISQVKSGLFITSAMLPLAFASIFYGYILEKVSIRKILSFAFSFLGITQIIFGFNSDYFVLLNIRGLQGLFLPVVLTGVMSYISQISNKENVSSAIGIYVGVTTLGGFLGRFLSGFFTDFFGWRFFIILIGCLMLIFAFFVFKINNNITASFAKPNPKDIISVFKIRHNYHICFMIFFAFFVFQAILNFLPFELTKLNNNFNGVKTGMIYFGYMLGMLISFNIKKIVSFFGTSQKTMIIGALIFIFSLQLFHLNGYSTIFIAMLVLCIGNFMLHSCASAFINKLADAHKGISNGLYVSFYYMGGALGSILPGFVYMPYGWHMFLLLLSIVSFFALSLLLSLNYVKK